MARGSVIRRCKICRRLGKSGFKRCMHKEAEYLIAYRVGHKQKREVIGSNKKEAERILTEKLSQLNNGTYFQIKDITLAEFAEKWLHDYAKNRIKPSTFYNYRNTIKTHLIPAFGKYFLTHITKEEIEKLMSKIIKKRTKKTANNVLVLMKTMFKYARRWGYIRENPVSDIDNFRVERQEMDFLRPDEILLLLKHANEPFRTLFFTAIFTGMRRGEILALQWGDIDWHSNAIYVRRSVHWRRRKEMEEGQEQRWEFITPKTKYSRRTLVMSPRLKEALELHRINSPVNAHDLVFCNQEGKPVDGNNMVKREYFPALSFAGLRRIRFHDLRHTFATILIDQGVNIKFIQSQLGHASIQTTMDRYGHLLPVDHRGVGERVDTKIFGHSAPPQPLQLASISHY